MPATSVPTDQRSQLLLGPKKIHSTGIRQQGFEYTRRNIKHCSKAWLLDLMSDYSLVLCTLHRSSCDVRSHSKDPEKETTTSAEYEEHARLRIDMSPMNGVASRSCPKASNGVASIRQPKRQPNDLKAKGKRCLMPRVDRLAPTNAHGDQIEISFALLTISSK